MQTFTSTHTQTYLTAISPGKPGLASWPWFFLHGNLADGLRQSCFMLDALPDTSQHIPLAGPCPFFIHCDSWKAKSIPFYGGWQTSLPNFQVNKNKTVTASNTRKWYPKKTQQCETVTNTRTLCLYYRSFYRECHSHSGHFCRTFLLLKVPECWCVSLRDFWVFLIRQ